MLWSAVQKKIICVECLHTRLLDCRVKWKWYSMFRVARTTVTVNFQVHYQIYFKSIMRCYHVHQSASSSVVGKKLFPNHESSSEAIAYNKFSIRIYWKIKNGSIETEHLVGHAPVEFLSLIFHFLSTDKNRSVTVHVTGKRKQEGGLVLPCEYFTPTDNIPMYKQLMTS